MVQKDKLGRDVPRRLVLDVPMQVIRVTNDKKKGKTRKEHLVSSIRNVSVIGYHKFATHLLVWSSFLHSRQKKEKKKSFEVETL